MAAGVADDEAVGVLVDEPVDAQNCVRRPTVAQRQVWSEQDAVTVVRALVVASMPTLCDLTYEPVVEAKLREGVAEADAEVPLSPSHRHLSDRVEGCRCRATSRYRVCSAASNASGRTTRAPG